MARLLVEVIPVALPKVSVYSNDEHAHYEKVGVLVRLQILP